MIIEQSRITIFTRTLSHEKQFIIAVASLGAFVSGNNNVQAQNSNPASTIVNIKLVDVFSIDLVNNEEVIFNYSTSADYNNYQEHTIINNLMVTSSKSFDIRLRAEGAHFVGNTTIDIKSH